MVLSHFKPFRLLISIIAVVGLVGVSSQAASAPSKPLAKPLCEGGGLRVETNFARAGANACSVRRVRGRLEIAISITPETTPINPSPWYGVRLVSRRQQSVSVTLDYASYKHRYHPHMARQIGDWTRVPNERVLTPSDGTKARIALDLAAGTTFLAGQPFDQPASMTEFLDAKVATGHVKRTVFGQSTLGIPLMSYQSVATNSGGTLIVLSRQHPPEVAGEWAFDAFVAALLADTAQAQAFRARFGILILPIMNPDGLAKGYWRSNAGLIDLNRDWGPFNQPETKAAGAHIMSVVAAAPALAMIDFHATNRDVIYAQPVSATLAPVGLVDNWLAAWTQALGPAAPKIDRAHNASNANSKTWGRLTLGIAAITYEVGDETPKADAQARARLAADLFMGQALALPATTNAPPLATNGGMP